ncbi:hypothetical protein R1sor_016726 [Riccia sorocarpa]|uniref:Replication factor C subunit 1 n=1 Tax=Riccia sorocarpa TaxID=122646 RepID=A0ABD3HJ64_9MARC
MSAQADIRKWFLKKPDHSKDKNENSTKTSTDEEGTGSKYKKESKFFAGGSAVAKNSTLSAGDKSKLKLEKKSTDIGKRKSEVGVNGAASQDNGTPPKKPRMVIPAGDESKVKVETPRGKQPKESPSKPPSAAKGRGNGKFVIVEDDEDLDYNNFEDNEAKTPSKIPTSSAGRGRGKPPVTPDVKSTPQKPAQTPTSTGRGRGKPSTDPDGDTKPSAGRGRGRGGGGFGGAPWASQGVPPHKGEKDVPQGAEDALAGLTFVISGTLDSLEREEAEVLVKSHGGRITGSVSKKTSYLLCDDDIGGLKSRRAKELGVKFLTEDELFEMIKASKPKATTSKTVDSNRAPSTKGTAAGVSVAKPSKPETKMKALPPSSKSGRGSGDAWQAWPAKHAPKTTVDIIGNQGIVKQLRDWLQSWEANFGHPVVKGGKGKKRVAASTSTDVKKAVLLSGTPGIGKTTTARLVCKELGYETLEVNASDARGKSDSNVKKGMDGRTANTIKEMVNNESICFTGKGLVHAQKSALIMDEVDGMSGGDRGGVADLIASIKSSRVPIICICNDRYSQKLKSLLNYCLVLNYRKPTKQQMAKRLTQIAKSEGLQVADNTLEEIAERSNGDMRTSLNQLQYMSLRSSALSFGDVHARLVASAKDEAISPFSAAEKLLGFDGRNLRMDQRVDMHMADPDLVPLIVQENYLNYTPSAASKDSTGLMHMDRAAHAAMSIAEGDIVNGQIRRRNQWQLSQTSAFLASIIPAALMQGQRKEFEGGRYNFNRFPAWLGKQSNYKKKVRLLEDVHIHLLASRICEPTRESIRLNYVPVLLLHITHSLRHLPKDEAVDHVVNLMNEYSLTQEDYETLLEVSEFKGHPDPLEGIQAAVKSALTRTYKSRIQERVVRSADLLPPLALPGPKKAIKKPKRLVLETEEAGLESEEIKDAEVLLSDQEDEGDEENEGGENIESLLSSYGTAKVSLDRGDEAKVTKGRGAAGKSKASDSKTPAKTPRKNKQETSKATPSSAKRRK